MALGHSDGSPEEPESDSDDYVPSEYDVNLDDEPPEEGPGDLIDVSSDKLVQKTLVQPGHGFIRPGRYDAVRVTRAKFMTGGGYRLLASAKPWRARSRLYRCQILQVNTKYSLESSRRDLHNTSFAPLWNPKSKRAGGKEHSWPETTTREDEKKKRVSNNSLSSISSKRSCGEKSKRMKVESDLHHSPISTSCSKRCNLFS